MLAGSPTNLHVVALRREEVAAPAAASAVASDGVADTGGEAMADAGEIEASALDPVAAGAAAALDAAPSPTPAPVAAPAPAPVETAAAAPARPTSSLARPFVQIGIFSVEQNARNTATAMRQAGMVPTVKQQSSSGKTFWRVIVGPAQSKSEIDALLEKIRAEGFTDAYAVSN